jgi:hypothetical protein
VILCAALAACAKGESDSGGGGGGADAAQLPDAGPRIDGGPDVDGSIGGGTAVTLTQSTSTAITEGNSQACGDLDGTFTSEASYFRVFDLAAEGITTPLMVTQVSFGIESAASGGAGQPVQVKIHALTGAFTNANLNAPVATASLSIPDQDLMIFDAPISGAIPAGSKLVVELHVPDGEADLNNFYPGSNTATEDAPTYVRDTCGGAEEPTPLANVGVDGMHWVLSVDGTK